MFSSRFLIVICIIVSVTSLCPASLIGKSFPDANVTEVSKIYTGGEFRCRISGTSLIAGAALRVKARGTDCSRDNAEAIAFLEKTVKQAKKIRLTNVRLRNYFRVIADIEVDGKSLCDKLVEKGFTKPVETAAGPAVVKRPSYLFVSGTTRGKTAESKSTKIAGGKAAATGKTAVTNSQITSSMKNSSPALQGKGFHPEMTFEEAIEQIRNSFSPPLPIVVLWPEIETSCLIDRDTPIGIEWNGKISVKKGLELLLMSVAPSNGVGLQYYVDGGIITIASKNINFNKPVLRVYNVAELTNVSPAMNRGYGYGSQGRYGNNGRYGNQGRYGNNNGMYGSQQRYGNRNSYRNSSNNRNSRSGSGFRGR